MYLPDPDTAGRRWGLDTTIFMKTLIALSLGANPVLFGVSTETRSEELSVRHTLGSVTRL